MSLSIFEKFIGIPIEAETKYVLIALSILSDDCGRIINLNSKQLEEFCDLGPRTVSIALNELRKMQYIQFLNPDFILLKPPKGGNYVC